MALIVVLCVGHVCECKMRGFSGTCDPECQ